MRASLGVGITVPVVIDIIPFSSAARIGRAAALAARTEVVELGDGDAAEHM